MSKDYKITVFLLIICIFLLGVVIAKQDSDKRLLIHTQMVLNTDDRFSIGVMETPFHRWTGYVYMYPLYQEKIEGVWTEKTGELVEGLMIGEILKTETYQVTYIIICSPYPITTIEEAEEVLWSDLTNTHNGYWFLPEPKEHRFINLLCPLR